MADISKIKLPNNSEYNIKDVSVPHTSETASSGGTALSLVTTGEKYTWNNKLADTTKYALSDSVGGDALNSKKVNNLTVQTAVPANAVFTDKKVTAVATDPTTQTTYYPIYVTGATNQQPCYSAKSGYAYTIKNGTASADGWCSFKIGNTTASGSADNMKGILTLCSSGTKYTDIVASASITANTTVTLPSSTGTLALTSEVADKMDKVNPTGSGYFSLNRKSGTNSGDYSVAIGYNCEASGDYAYAEGYQCIANFERSHAEGNATQATNTSAHAEGSSTEASGQHSHAEGYHATAKGNCSHAEGNYTTAVGRSQHVFGEFNVSDTDPGISTKPVHVEIVGNGSSTTPSNARTLDWSGNEILSGHLQATAIYSNTSSNPGASGGLSLYTTNAPDIYGIAMRTTASLGKHGCVQGDYATYYSMKITTNNRTRGWIFRGGETGAFANVVSINVDGDAAFNGSVTIGANTTNTSGCRLTYNSTTKSCDFVFA